MDISDIVLQMAALCACAISVCRCGGTLEHPEPDSWLCDHLVPPGMEGKEPVRTFSLYITANSWYKHFIILATIGVGDYNFIGIIHQGRIDDKVSGVFPQNNSESTTVLDCPPYMKNLFYTINLKAPKVKSYAYWVPPRKDYHGKNLTMLTTIIKDTKNYYTFVDIIRPNTALTTSTSTSTEMAAISDETTTGDDESTTQQDDVIAL